jgi:tetratricopeptide (TPR) repeat protein
MDRGSKRGNALSSMATLRVAITWIAVGSLGSLIVAGTARGQDLAPAPRDFKVPTGESTPIFGPTPFAAKAATDSQAQTRTQERRDFVRAMMKGGLHKEALQCLEDVIRQDPKNPDALMLRAWYRTKLGLPMDDSLVDDELTAVDQLLEKAPEDAKMRGVRGALLTSKGDFDRAILELTYAIDHRLTWDAFYYYRGLARMRRRDYKEAVDDFNTAAGLSGPRQIPAQIFTARGRCYAALGEQDRAISDFTKVIDRFPSAYGPYELRAEAYFRKYDLKNCLADQDQIVKLRPDDFIAYVARGFVRYQNHDRAGALSDMDRAVQLGQTSPAPYFCRAVLAVLVHQDGDRNLADMDRAIALLPRFAFFYAFRGYLHARKSMYVPAGKDLVLCLYSLTQMEFKPYVHIDQARGHWAVGLNWRIKGSRKEPKPVWADTPAEEQAIPVAIQHLVAAVLAPAK